MKERNSFKEEKESNLVPRPQKKMMLVVLNPIQIVVVGNQPWKSRVNTNKAKRLSR